MSPDITDTARPDQSKSVYLVNLGCPKNLVDGEVMLGLLAERGYRLSLDPAAAEILMVNTCSFIDEAKQESIETILDLASYKHAGAAKQLVVTGCLAQRYGKELCEALPEVDVFVGTGEFVRITDILERKRRQSERPVAYIGASHILPDHTVPRIPTTQPYSAYLKLGEGCNHKCAFCIIPKIRGRQESRPIDSLVAEAERLVELGARELNLIAQDLTAYGRERRDGTTLLGLLKALCRVDGLDWIRLLYCYPNYLDAHLLDFIAEQPRVCSYIDMPLQHISDAMLRRMKREKSGDGIRRLLRRIRCAIPGVVLRSSFIVGFPGEGADDFRQLCDFVREAALDHVGVFRYSQEDGTLAGSMPDQVDEAVKEERWHRLMACQAEVVRQKNTGRLGQTQPVLVCGRRDDGEWWGRTQGQAPDIDGVVLLDDCWAEAGDIVPTEITAVSDYDLRARCVPARFGVH